MPEEQAVIAVKPEDLYPDQNFKDMVEAGLFYGRKKSRTNPKMKSYILTNRAGIEIVNLGKTTEVLEEAAEFVKETVRKGGLILFVATQPSAETANELAKEYGYPYVTRRWLGGTLTNFKVISKRIEYYKKLKSEWGTNALDKYTKKERLMIEKEMTRLEELMGGLGNLIDKPSALVVVDPNLHMSAVREARILKIPIIAFANTDSDPDLLDFPVVGNNKARLSVNWFVDKLRVAIAEGKKLGPIVPETSAETPKTEKKEEKPAVAHPGVTKHHAKA